MSAKNKAPMPETLAAWRFLPEEAGRRTRGGWSDDHDHKTTSYTRTDALDRIVQEAVKEALTVKPLVWLDKGSRDGWLLRWQAGEDGCRWHFQITQQVSIGQHDYTLSCGLTGNDVGSYKTLEEARTAAQARYEARILAALKGGEA